MPMADKLHATYCIKTDLKTGYVHSISQDLYLLVKHPDLHGPVPLQSILKQSSLATVATKYKFGTLHITRPSESTYIMSHYCD